MIFCELKLYVVIYLIRLYMRATAHKSLTKVKHDMSQNSTKFFVVIGRHEYMINVK
jgi:predicted nucleic acid-binding Zn finger protein